MVREKRLLSVILRGKLQEPEPSGPLLKISKLRCRKLPFKRGFGPALNQAREFVIETMRSGYNDLEILLAQSSACGESKCEHLPGFRVPARRVLTAQRQRDSRDDEAAMEGSASHGLVKCAVK